MHQPVKHPPFSSTIVCKVIMSPYSAKGLGNKSYKTFSFPTNYVSPQKFEGLAIGGGSVESVTKRTP